MTYQKVTAEDVIFIRQSKDTHRHLASLFGIADTTVSRIRRGVLFPYLPGACPSLSQRDHLPSLEERVASSYTPEPTSGCWLWVGYVANHGYGEFVFVGKRFLAHRASYELAHGQIPDGMKVLHKCDVRSCINPDHLFVGTHLDNMRDMVAKGRSVAGERSNRAKLTSSQVAAILLDKRGAMEIAQDYGVSDTLIRNIRKRKAWRHIHA